MGRAYRIGDDYSGGGAAFMLAYGRGFLEILAAAKMPNRKREHSYEEGWVGVPVCYADLSHERFITSASYPLLYEGIEVKTGPGLLVLRLQYLPAYPDRIIFFAEGHQVSKKQVDSELDLFKQRTELGDADMPSDYIAFFQQMDIADRIRILQLFSQNI